MTIQVDLSAGDFRRFSVFDTLKRRKMWRNPTIFAAILCASAAVCFCMPHIRGSRLLGIVLTVVGLGVPCAYFLSFYLSLGQKIRQLGLSRPQRVYTLTFEECDKQLHIDNEKEHVDYPWKKVHHAYRDLTATYLYITPRQAFILPHTCLEDPDSLWALIQKKLPKEKYSVI